MYPSILVFNIVFKNKTISYCIVDEDPIIRRVGIQLTGLIYTP